MGPHHSKIEVESLEESALVRGDLSYQPHVKSVLLR